MSCLLGVMWRLLCLGRGGKGYRGKHRTNQSVLQHRSLLCWLNTQREDVLMQIRGSGASPGILDEAEDCNRKRTADYGQAQKYDAAYLIGLVNGSWGLAHNILLLVKDA